MGWEGPPEVCCKGANVLLRRGKRNGRAAARWAEWEGMRRMERYWREAYGKVMDGQVVLYRCLGEIYRSSCEEDARLVFFFLLGYPY